MRWRRNLAAMPDRITTVTSPTQKSASSTGRSLSDHRGSNALTSTRCPSTTTNAKTAMSSRCCRASHPNRVPRAMTAGLPQPECCRCRWCFTRDLVSTRPTTVATDQHRGRNLNLTVNRPIPHRSPKRRLKASLLRPILQTDPG